MGLMQLVLLTVDCRLSTVDSSFPRCPLPPRCSPCFQFSVSFAPVRQSADPPRRNCSMCQDFKFSNPIGGVESVTIRKPGTMIITSDDERRAAASKMKLNAMVNGGRTKDCTCTLHTRVFESRTEQIKLSPSTVTTSNDLLYGRLPEQ